jgi:dephospho-CoA kinase
MVIVGITGGIGSGKSVISKLLMAMGYPVYDSDAEAKKIMQTDLSVIKELQLEFGESTYINSQLNKQHIAREVFGNPERLRALNAIVHPAVKRHFQAWAKHQSSSVVFLETAILFESGFNSETHKVILVTAPLDIRIERVLRRDQCTPKQVMQRIAQQWTEEAKALQSNFIIVNDGLHSLIKQTEKIISDLTQ